MTLHVERRQVEAEVVTGFTCDCCENYYDAEDDIALQEAQIFNFTGGFGSAWGDGTHVQCVLCEACTKNLIQPFATVTPPAN